MTDGNCVQCGQYKRIQKYNTDLM